MPILEAKPNSPLANQFPPANGKKVKVKTGDNWESIAKNHGLEIWDLIEFNFPAVRETTNFGRKCREVNWMLRTHVGTTKSSDGQNYRFDSSDNPGYVYVPTKPIPPSPKLDDVKTKLWALAPAGKPTATRVPFELLNRETKRAHRLVLIGVGHANASVTQPPKYYSKLHVRLPVSFHDFNKCWGSLRPAGSTLHKLTINLKTEKFWFESNWYSLHYSGPYWKHDYIIWNAVFGATRVEFGSGKPTHPLIWEAIPGG